MKYTQFLLITGLALAIFSCSKSSSTPDPTPVEEDLTTPIAGVYKLTKVTPRSGTVTVTGVGSFTIVAVDKTTVKITQIRSFTNTATGAPTSLSNTDETSKIVKNSSSYTIKTPNGVEWATISSGKVSTNDILNLSIGTAVTLDTEYTKQ